MFKKLILIIIAVIALCGCSSSDKAVDTSDRQVPVEIYTTKNSDPNLPLSVDVQTRVQVDPGLTEVAKKVEPNETQQSGLPQPYPFTITNIRNLVPQATDQTVTPTPGGLPQSLFVWRVATYDIIKKIGKKPIVPAKKTSAGDILLILYVDEKAATLAQGTMRSYGLLDDYVIAVDNVVIIHPDPSRTQKPKLEWTQLLNKLNTVASTL